jgi:hypothetical protein
VLLVVTGAVLLYLPHSDAIRKTSSVASANWTLHSSLPYGEVEVPFTLHKGHIFVQADFAGVPLTCLVDTGVRDIVMQNGDVPHLYTNGTVSYFGSNGGSVLSEWVTLSHIRLGDYELSEPMAISWPLTASSFGYTLEGFPIFATLGNRAFKNVVLTIDYQQRKLILRRPDYDITQQSHDPKASSILHQAATMSYGRLSIWPWKAGSRDIQSIWCWIPGIAAQE